MHQPSQLFSNHEINITNEHEADQLAILPMYTVIFIIVRCPMTADIILYVTHMCKVIYVTYMQFLITAVLHVCNIYVE